MNTIIIRNVLEFVVLVPWYSSGVRVFRLCVSDSAQTVLTTLSLLHVHKDVTFCNSHLLNL